MRHPPLLDLSALDLDRVVVTKEEIYRVMPHRHEMALLDGLLYFDRERGEAVALHEVHDDEFWVRGHIPGRPLMPGVLLIEAMAQAAGYLILSLGDFQRMPFLAQVQGAKIRSPVLPGTALLVDARRIHAGSGYAVLEGAVRRETGEERRPVAEAELRFRVGLSQ